MFARNIETQRYAISEISETKLDALNARGVGVQLDNIYNNANNNGMPFTAALRAAAANQGRKPRPATISKVRLEILAAARSALVNTALKYERRAEWASKYPGHVLVVPFCDSSC